MTRLMLKLLTTYFLLNPLLFAQYGLFFSALTGQSTVPSLDILTILYPRGYQVNPLYVRFSDHLYESIDSSTPHTDITLHDFYKLAQSLSLQRNPPQEKVIQSYLFNRHDRFVGIGNWQYFPINWQTKCFEKAEWMIGDYDDQDLTILNFTVFGSVTYFLMEIETKTGIKHFLAHENMLISFVKWTPS